MGTGAAVGIAPFIGRSGSPLEAGRTGIGVDSAAETTGIAPCASTKSGGITARPASVPARSPSTSGVAFSAETGRTTERGSGSGCG